MCNCHYHYFALHVAHLTASHHATHYLMLWGGGLECVAVGYSVSIRRKVKLDALVFEDGAFKAAGNGTSGPQGLRASLRRLVRDTPHHQKTNRSHTRKFQKPSFVLCFVTLHYITLHRCNRSAVEL